MIPIHVKSWISTHSPRELFCPGGDAGIILQKHVQVHIKDRIHQNERIPKSTPALHPLAGRCQGACGAHLPRAQVPWSVGTVVIYLPNAARVVDMRIGLEVVPIRFVTNQISGRKL
jgi:hypothetical protein